MVRRLRKVVALALSAWLLVLGSGYAAASSGEAQHELEWVQAAAQPSGEGGAADLHGCAGHFSAHLLALPQDACALLADSCVASPFLQLDAGLASVVPDRFSPPPKISLA